MRPTLVEMLKEWYKENSYPPDGPELDDDIEQVSYKVLDSGQRWGNNIQVVYKDNLTNAYVAVYDVEPATEMQDWGDYGDPEIALVEPYEVTTVKYRKVQ